MALLLFSGHSDSRSMSALAEQSTKLARISGTGTRANLGRRWELAAVGCVGARRTIGRLRRRSSAYGWDCCSSGSRRRRLLIVRVGDDYVDITSLFTLKLEGTTNDATPAGPILTHPSSQNFQIQLARHGCGSILVLAPVLER